MTGWKIGKIGMHEYGIVNLVIIFTTVIWLTAGLMYINAISPLITWIVLIITTIGMLLILGFAVYERINKVKPSMKYEDERSNMCSLKATRNAFITTLLFLAMYMIILQISPSTPYNIPALQAIFGISIAVYIVSWYYYIHVN